MLFQLSSIPLWVALVAEVCAWGVLVWRMLVMAPKEYRARIVFSLVWVLIIFNVQDRIQHFGLESAAAQAVALYGAIVLSTLGKRDVFLRIIALAGKKDADSTRMRKRLTWAYTARLVAGVALLMTLMGVLVRGAL